MFILPLGILPGSTVCSQQRPIYVASFASRVTGYSALKTVWTDSGLASVQYTMAPLFRFSTLYVPPLPHAIHPARHSTLQPPCAVQHEWTCVWYQEVRGAEACWDSFSRTVRGRKHKTQSCVHPFNRDWVRPREGHSQPYLIPLGGKYLLQSRWDSVSQQLCVQSGNKSCVCAGWQGGFWPI